MNSLYIYSELAATVLLAALGFVKNWRISNGK